MFPLDALKEANRAVIARLVEREKLLADRERMITDELESIANERRTLASDRETIQKAEAIQDRLFGTSGTLAVAPLVAAVEARLEAGQARARIGPQRYLMMAALRDGGPMTVEDIAAETGLSMGRVREQMRSDQPLYVQPGPGISADPSSHPLILTVAGLNLLTRFENYRRSQGKPLPKGSDTGEANDDANDDDEPLQDADTPADPQAHKDEAAGEMSVPDAPTASVTDTVAQRGSVFD